MENLFGASGPSWQAVCQLWHVIKLEDKGLVLAEDGLLDLNGDAKERR